MITAIVSSQASWYCQKCKDTHKVLYINGDNKYCYRCLPEDLKGTQGTYVNQNRQEIQDYKERFDA